MMSDEQLEQTEQRMADAAPDPVKYDLTPDEWTDLPGTLHGTVRVMPMKLDDGKVHATQAWVTADKLIDADAPVRVDYDYRP